MSSPLEIPLLLLFYGKMVDEKILENLENCRTIGTCSGAFSIIGALHFAPGALNFPFKETIKSYFLLKKLFKRLLFNNNTNWIEKVCVWENFRVTSSLFSGEENFIPARVPCVWNWQLGVTWRDFTRLTPPPPP